MKNITLSAKELKQQKTPICRQGYRWFLKKYGKLVVTYEKIYEDIKSDSTLSTSSKLEFFQVLEHVYMNKVESV